MDSRLCCRCGRRPRTAETFLCQPCLDDPAARKEAAEAFRRKDARRYVIATYGWAGGWPGHLN